MQIHRLHLLINFSAMVSNNLKPAQGIKVEWLIKLWASLNCVPTDQNYWQKSSKLTNLDRNKVFCPKSEVVTDSPFSVDQLPNLCQSRSINSHTSKYRFLEIEEEGVIIIISEKKACWTVLPALDFFTISGFFGIRLGI